MGIELQQRLDEAGLAGPAGGGDDEEVAGGVHGAWGQEAMP
jgi:hypothetical protein